MPRLLLIVLVAGLAVAGCGGDDKPTKLTGAEYTAINAFLTGEVTSPKAAEAVCQKLKSAKSTAMVDVARRSCDDGLQVVIGTTVAETAIQAACKSTRPSPGCQEAFRLYRRQIVAYRGVLEAYNEGVENAMGEGECRDDLRDTDASRLTPFLENYDQALQRLEQGDASAMGQVGAVPDQDTGRITSCKPS